MNVIRFITLLLPHCPLKGISFDVAHLIRDRLPMFGEGNVKKDNHMETSRAEERALGRWGMYIAMGRDDEPGMLSFLHCTNTFAYMLTAQPLTRELHSTPDYLTRENGLTFKRARCPDDRSACPASTAASKKHKACQLYVLDPASCFNDCLSLFTAQSL